jgi:hypothetical protein
VLLNDLVGTGEHRGRYGEAERFRGLEIDHELEFRGLLHRNVGRLHSTQNLIDKLSGAPLLVGEIRPIGHQAVRFDVLRTAYTVGSRALNAKLLIRTRLVFTSGSTQT